MHRSAFDEVTAAFEVDRLAEAWAAAAGRPAGATPALRDLVAQVTRGLAAALDPAASAGWPPAVLTAVAATSWPLPRTARSLALLRDLVTRRLEESGRLDLPTYRRVVALFDALTEVINPPSRVGHTTPSFRRGRAQIAAVRALGQGLTLQRDLPDVLAVLVRHARVVLGADLAGVITVEPAQGMLEWRAIDGNVAPAAPARYELGRGLLGRVLALGRPVTVDGVGVAPEYPAAEFPVLAREGIRTALGVPIQLDRAVRGALVIGWRRRRRVGSTRVHLAQVLAEQASVALELARLHTASEEAGSLLRAVVDHLPEGVLVIAPPDARVVIYNRAAERIVGPLAQATLAGADVAGRFRLSRPDGSPIATEDLPSQRALRRGETVLGEELVHSRADGARIDLLVNASPLRAADGTVTASVAVFQDITQLKALMRAKDEFLRIASHELRTPLTTIKGHAQLLARRSVRAATGSVSLTEIQGSLEALLAQVDRLSTLVDDLLEFSRLQANRLELRLTTADLREVVRRTVEQQTALLGPSHTLRLELPDAPLPARIDVGRIEQVLTNLLSNAAKYSPAGGPIVVRVEREGETVRLSVADTGVGVPSGELARLFQPYQRTSTVQRLALPGQGLGLYICRGIVEQHGGAIWADSPGENQGTTVHVRLPLAAPEEPSRASRRPARPAIPAPADT